MDLKELAGIKHLHHAYVVVGTVAYGFSEIQAVLKKRGVTTAGNPDFFSVSDSEFTVDRARDVASFASLKPLGERKYVIISFSRATTEAQNALLKVVEEAPGSSVFFFCVESAGHVLPTLRSRCVQVSSGRAMTDSEDTKEAEKFLTETYPYRLAVVEKMTSYIAKTQDRLPARNFVQALLKAAREQKVPVPYLRDLLNADRFMRMQGSSAKAILSHLAVTMPRTK